MLRAPGSIIAAGRKGSELAHHLLDPTINTATSQRAAFGSKRCVQRQTQCEQVGSCSDAQDSLDLRTTFPNALNWLAAYRCALFSG
jgi:hypothetical protein